MKKISKRTGILVAVLLIALIGYGIFCIPQVHNTVYQKLHKYKIERQLKNKYHTTFHVTEIESGDGMLSNSRYQEQPSPANAFIAYTKDSQIIVGNTDDAFCILYDSYSFYLYEEQLQDYVTNLLSSSDTPLYCYPMLIPMRSESPFSVSNFTEFYEQTDIYDSVYLFVPESITDEQENEILSTLRDTKFHFTVKICHVTESELETLTATNPLYLNSNETADINTVMNDSEWLDTKDRTYAQLYMWYKN